MKNPDSSKQSGAADRAAGQPTHFLELLKGWSWAKAWRDQRKALPATVEVAKATEGPAVAECALPLHFLQNTPPAWEDMPGTDCVREWAHQVAAAIRKSPGAPSWELVGPHALLQVEDLQRGRDILHRSAIEAGLQFAVVQADDVLGLDLSCFTSQGPALVYLEADAWLLANRSEDESVEQRQAINRYRLSLRSFIGAIDPHQAVVLASVVKDIDHAAASLRSVDYFPRRLAIRPATSEESGASYLRQLGTDYCSPGLLQDQRSVGMVAKVYDNPRVRGLQILALRRLALEQQRLLEFADLVAVATLGTVETDSATNIDPNWLRMIATHEAGHAVVAMIDSRGDNIPELLTILPGFEFNGLSVDSVSYHAMRQEHMTYAGMRHSVRTMLAGRAAEEVVFGPEHVGEGAAEDLRKATQKAAHAFAILGFAPDMAREGQSASNLAIVIDEPTPSECAHVESLVREFLSEEYKAVLHLLTTHRALLDATIAALLAHKVLHQTQIRAIAERHAGAFLL